MEIPHSFCHNYTTSLNNDLIFCKVETKFCHFIFQFFPVVYALMAKRTVSAYRDVFHKVMEVCPQWKPKNIMCDFESALHSALREVFPEVIVKGCWFHFAQVRAF